MSLSTRRLAQILMTNGFTGVRVEWNRDFDNTLKGYLPRGAYVYTADQLPDGTVQYLGYTIAQASDQAKQDRYFPPVVETPPEVAALDPPIEPATVES